MSPSDYRPIIRPADSDLQYDTLSRRILYGGLQWFKTDNEDKAVTGNFENEKHGYSELYPAGRR